MLGIHPTIIAESFSRAAQKAVDHFTAISTPIDLNDRESLLRAASTSLNSKVEQSSLFFLVFHPANIYRLLFRLFLNIHRFFLQLLLMQLSDSLHLRPLMLTFVMSES